MEITRRNFLTGAAAMGGLAAFGLAGCAPKSVQADADEALAETGGETSATATEGAEVTPEPTPDATVDADVVVIGGGGIRQSLTSRESPSPFSSRHGIRNLPFGTMSAAA